LFKQGISSFGKDINNEDLKGVITVNDYTRTIYHVMSGEFDNLLLMMTRTKDDMLAKKIETFLHAYYYAPSNEEVIKNHDHLLYYIDHALDQVDQTKIKI